MNYKNQKEIFMNKEEISQMYNNPNNKDEQFLHSLKWDALLPVIRELNGNEFKVWLYCMKWAGKGSFYFSPAALIADFNMSESTAQRCFKSLEQLGYLQTKSVNGYIFHPQKCSQNESIQNDYIKNAIKDE